MKCSSCSKVVLPVVAWDIDGVLGDYHGHFTDFCIKYYGMVPFNNSMYLGDCDFEDYLGLTKIEYRAAKLAYRQGGWKRWMPTWGDAAKLVNEVRNAGAEVWIATTRPWQRLDNIDPDTREWLRRTGISYDGLLYGDDKYHQLSEAVEPARVVGVVDDLLVQCEIADKLGLPVTQVDRPHNSHRSQVFPVRKNLMQVADWMIANINQWKVEHGAD